MKKTIKAPCFATGPVRKAVSWKVNNHGLDTKLNLLGRSHRCKDFLNLTQSVVNKIKKLLKLPPDYKIVTLTGGATAAVEMALWNFTGVNSLDCISWEFFGELWYEDLIDHLNLENVNLHRANFGSYPNINNVDFINNDVLFVYSGSTSGVVFKDENKIPLKRNGLIISDATSYLFMYDIPWEKLDIVAFSWQKILAGEAAHGMLILSPKAIERLKNYTPSWPIPKIFRLKDKNGNLIEEVFDTGLCLNTPSALAFIDVNCNLDLIIQKGGIEYLHNKINDNYELVKKWVNDTPWISFLVEKETYRSKVIICLRICDEIWTSLSLEKQKLANKFILNYLEDNNLAYDIGMYRLAPVIGFRLWIGPTIAKSDIKDLIQNLEKAYKQMIRVYYK